MKTKLEHLTDRREVISVLIDEHQFSIYDYEQAIISHGEEIEKLKLERTKLNINIIGIEHEEAKND